MLASLGWWGALLCGRAMSTRLAVQLGALLVAAAVSAYVSIPESVQSRAPFQPFSASRSPLAVSQPTVNGYSVIIVDSGGTIVGFVLVLLSTLIKLLLRIVSQLVC